MISVVACCRGAKLCAHAARYFRSQQKHQLRRLPGGRGRLQDETNKDDYLGGDEDCKMKPTKAMTWGR